jgi:hypothetical protein
MVEKFHMEQQIRFSLPEYVFIDLSSTLGDLEMIVSDDERLIERLLKDSASHSASRIAAAYRDLVQALVGDCLYSFSIYFCVFSLSRCFSGTSKVAVSGQVLCSSKPKLFQRKHLKLTNQFLVWKAFVLSDFVRRRLWVRCCADKEDMKRQRRRLSGVWIGWLRIRNTSLAR